jgi:hypothetical protein
VAFTAPGSDGGSAITGYTATSSPGGFTGSGASSPITVTGLTNGTAYTFTVTATNAVGTGTASAASNSVTPATTPGAPTIGAATGGNSQAAVAFTAPASDGGSAITGYTATSSPGGLTATGASSPLTVTGLTNGIAYTFTVTATNAVGTGAASAASNSVTPAASGTTFTIHPSAQAGDVESGDSGTYSAARSGTGSLGLFANPGADIRVGQTFFSGDTYNPSYVALYEGFLDFSLASVTGTVVSATLSLGLGFDFSDTDFAVEARTRDWGASLSTADWVAGASLGGLTLLATLATSGIGAVDAYKAMTQTGTALKDAVVAAGAGTLRILLCSDLTRLNNSPGGDEFVLFYPQGHATLKPKLVVVTS